MSLHVDFTTGELTDLAIILASASPRRKAILEMLGTKDLKVMPAKGEEIVPPDAGPAETVESLSRAKALEVAKKCSQSDVIIAADTIVWLEDRLLGKPSDEVEAVNMLRELSGNCHEVYTGITVIKGESVNSEHEVSKVFFRKLTDEEIKGYISTDEPMDKAGAYGAQGIGALFIERIEGDFFNVMGLPVCRLGKMLKKQGVKLL